MSETPPPVHGDTAGETWHLSAELFRRFLEQRVSPPERRAVMRHLVTQCPDCFALAERITAEAGYWTGEDGADAPVDRDYTEAFQAAFQFATHGAQRLAVERLHGWAHWSALDPLSPDARLAAIVQRKDWQHWGLFRALLDAAHGCSSHDPAAAADVAALALHTADLLDPIGPRRGAADRKDDAVPLAPLPPRVQEDAGRKRRGDLSANGGGGRRHISA
jgi:hypothetical protein